MTVVFFFKLLLFTKELRKGAVNFFPILLPPNPHQHECNLLLDSTLTSGWQKIRGRENLIYYIYPQHS